MEYDVTQDDQDAAEVAECGGCHQVKEIEAELTATATNRVTGEEVAQKTVKLCLQCCEQAVEELKARVEARQFASGTIEYENGVREEVNLEGGR